MNITFVLGQYKPNACGISDYVNLLSIELEKRGHFCQRISIDPTKGSTFLSVSQNLPQADLISLQFAPYAFSPYGLSGVSLLKFGQAIRDRKLHVMFHEIWVGAYPRASWKERFTGWRQKKEIMNFLDIARPKAVHTSNSAALDRLKRKGTNAQFLYLFGNIPYAPLPEERLINGQKLRIAFFGTLYESFPYIKFFKILNEFSITSKQTICLIVLGRHRDQLGLVSLKENAEIYKFEIEFMGELNTEEISHHLQRSDLGVSTTPFDVLGKSGTSAAMLEHGLPLLTYDDGDTQFEQLFVFEPFKEQVLLLNDPNWTEKMANRLAVRKRSSFFNGVAQTADNLLEAII